MTLTQLRTFLAVADTGSVRAAAARLVVTQPAVSSAVAALQRELGVALVARDGRGLRLTPAGARFADGARRVLGLLDEAAAAAVGADAPGRGRVRLAAVTTVGEHVLPRHLASFLARHPEATVTLEVGNRARVWSLLDHHEVDLAIGGRPPAGAPFAVRAVRRNELVLVAAPALLPARGRRRAAVVPADLARHTWLLREPGSGTRAAVEELLAGYGIDPPMLTLGSNGAIRESARFGLGITVLSRDAAAADLDQGTLVEWAAPGLPIARPWHVVARNDTPLGPTAGLLLAHLVRARGLVGQARFRTVEPVPAGAGGRRVSGAGGAAVPAGGRAPRP